MFKKHEFRVKMVKTPKDEDGTDVTLDDVLNPDSVRLIEEAGQRFVKRTVIMIAGTAVALKVVDILGDIVVSKTTK
jgi:hypothetical protein